MASIAATARLNAGNRWFLFFIILLLLLLFLSVQRVKLFCQPEKQIPRRRTDGNAHRRAIGCHQPAGVNPIRRVQVGILLQNKIRCRRRPGDGHGWELRVEGDREPRRTGRLHDRDDAPKSAGK